MNNNMAELINAEDEINKLVKADYRRTTILSNKELDLIMVSYEAFHKTDPNDKSEIYRIKIGFKAPTPLSTEEQLELLQEILKRLL